MATSPWTNTPIHLSSSRPSSISGQYGIIDTSLSRCEGSGGLEFDLILVVDLVEMVWISVNNPRSLLKFANPD
ncbi:hypothetical protein L6452_34967 [Arctium lappa]|uniref:Uncharacterized protein n=1 Tax=Arctium lappa TaxID=4217 RepID=A0ACB8YKV6_ARCLA|nr:hypothetical protein L6452_34967 [Arctium lappa]